MDLSDSPAEAAFRARVRAWLAQTLPTLPWPEPADLADKLPFWQKWQALLFEAGYGGISWPREYGGQGADAEIRSIFNEEADRAGRRRSPPRHQLLPAADEQSRRHGGAAAPHAG